MNHDFPLECDYHVGSKARVPHWCEVCLRGKSKQAKSRKLSLRQPVLQMDFSFIFDKPGDDSVTVSSVVDVLTGMSLSVVIPTKSRTTCSQAELRRSVLETGRTVGVAQCNSSLRCVT